jgi:O-antigen/teichoic acid export membrane protein
LANKLSDYTIKLHSSHIRKILNFGLQSSVASFLFYLLDYIDRLILKELVPLSDVGIYSLGVKLASVISVILILPFSLIWAPMRMEYATNNNSKEFTVKIFSYLSMVGFIIISISILFAEDIMSLVFINKEFSEAAQVFPVIMLALLFFGFQNILDFGIYLYKKVIFYSLIALIGIAFNVIMNYWLIPYFGYMVSAYITLFTYLLTTLLIYLVSSYYHQIKYEWVRIIIPLFVVIAMYFIKLYLDLTNSFTFAQKILITLTLLLFIIFFWFDKKEKKTIKNFIQDLTQK